MMCLGIISWHVPYLAPNALASMKLTAGHLSMTCAS
jgi:hypothetical protein